MGKQPCKVACASFALAVLAVVTTTAVVASEPAGEWAFQRRMAMDAVDSGNWTAADASFAAAVSAAADSPGDPGRVLQTLREWVVAGQRLQRWDRAIELQSRLVDLQREDAAVTPLGRVRALEQLAALQQAHGEPGSGEPALREALGLREALTPDVLPSEGQLLRELSRAIESIRRDDPEVLERLEQRAGIDASTAAWEDIARYWSVREQPDRSTEALLRAIDIEGGTRHPDRRRLARLWERVGREALLSDDLEQAEGAFEQALALREATLGSEHPFLVSALRGLAEVFAAEERFSDADRVLFRAERLGETAWGTTASACSCRPTGLRETIDRALGREVTVDEPPAGPSVELVEAARLGQEQHRSGEVEAALATYEKALGELEGSDNTDPASQALMLRRLADLHFQLRDFERADAYYRRELEARDAVGQRLLAARAVEALARAARDRGEFDRAADYHRQAAERWRDIAGAEAPETRIDLAGSGADLTLAGRYDEAETLLKTLLAEIDAAGDPAPGQLLVVLRPLRELYRKRDGGGPEWAAVGTRIRELEPGH